MLERQRVGGSPSVGVRAAIETVAPRLGGYGCGTATVMPSAIPSRLPGTTPTLNLTLMHSAPGTTGHSQRRAATLNAGAPRHHTPPRSAHPPLIAGARLLAAGFVDGLPRRMTLADLRPGVAFAATLVARPERRVGTRAATDTNDPERQCPGGHSQHDQTDESLLHGIPLGRGEGTGL